LSTNASAYNTHPIEGFRRPDAVFKKFRTAIDEALKAMGAHDDCYRALAMLAFRYQITLKQAHG
jgi:hypothetical protein